MKKQQQMVEEFHRTFELGVGEKPTGAKDKAIKRRRFRLIYEELSEYMEADNMVDIADAIGDMLYVVLGTAVEHGVDIEPIFEEIHRSNMSKVGGHKNEYGKFIKPDTYSPAELTPIIASQLAKSI